MIVTFPFGLFTTRGSFMMRAVQPFEEVVATVVGPAAKATPCTPVKINALAATAVSALLKIDIAILSCILNQSMVGRVF